jgi:hypothetical protein
MSNIDLFFIGYDLGIKAFGALVGFVSTGFAFVLFLSLLLGVVSLIANLFLRLIRWWE